MESLRPRGRAEVTALYRIVLRAAKRTGTAQQLATDAGVSLSALLRGAKTGKLSTDTLLAIAEAGGEDPRPLLRAAGKGATADRLTRMFGTVARPLTTDERALLALSDGAKRQLCRIVDGLT